MASPYDLVASAVLVALAGTAVAAIAWGLLLERQFPQAAFQLRLFHNLEGLAWGLRAVDVAILLLIIAFLPGLLAIQTPEAWRLFFVTAAAAAVWYGLFEFARVFRVPKAPVLSAAEEGERGSP
jgi:hypothetical protein